MVWGERYINCQRGPRATNPATLIFTEDIRNDASSRGDVTKLLNFNPERKLEFDLDRHLQFSPSRELGFNVDRELSFDLNRDLGFGKRGVVFRGYVCSSCGALVNPLATQCDECGAVFEVKKPKKRKKAKKKPRSRRKFCRYCGSPISSSDSYCSHCGLRLSGGSEMEFRITVEGAPEESHYDVLKLPKKSQEKALTDWRDTGKKFEDFLEE
ncbi:MAG: zinc-ribbon domain-containing protein [Thermoplasmata archaeon]